MWSLAVEAAFYVVLPLLAYLLLVRDVPAAVAAEAACWAHWLALALISPAWLVLVHTDHWFPDGARLWLPTYLAWFLGRHDAGGAAGDGGARATRSWPYRWRSSAISSSSTPIAGAPTTSPATLSEALVKTCFYAVDRGAGGGAAGPG